MGIGAQLVRMMHLDKNISGVQKMLKEIFGDSVDGNMIDERLIPRNYRS